MQSLPSPCLHGTYIKSGLHNIRSATEKFSLLTQLFSDKNLDLLILTETW